MGASVSYSLDYSYRTVHVPSRARGVFGFGCLAELARAAGGEKPATHFFTIYQRALCTYWRGIPGLISQDIPPASIHRLHRSPRLLLSDLAVLLLQ